MGNTSEGTRTSPPPKDMNALEMTAAVDKVLTLIDTNVSNHNMSASKEAQYYMRLSEGIHKRLFDNITR